jgi:glycosyltransferase involved in cell wall biosynthesis
VGDYSGDVFYSAYDALRRQAEQLGLGDAVRFAGYVADEDLVYLYSAAEVFVLPSLLEGFGLPVIEAMACGAPVLASCRGALPEVVGQAGVLFDPDRPGDLHDGLRRLLTDSALRERLRTLGPHRAAEFSWDHAARKALAAFRSLVETAGNGER